MSTRGRRARVRCRGMERENDQHPHGRLDDWGAHSRSSKTRAAGGRLVLRAPRLLSRVLTSRVERLHTLRQRDRDRRGVAPPAGSFTLLRLGWRSGTMSDGNRMIRAFSAEETLARAGQLAEVLLDCIAGGASVSFMEDFSRDEATEYWRA